MSDPHFETLLTDCLGQFWKARYGLAITTIELSGLPVRESDSIRFSEDGL
jgi:hypothetical protein